MANQNQDKILHWNTRANNKKVWVFNTHFDHIGVNAREQSAKLIDKNVRPNMNINITVTCFMDKL